MNFRRGQRYQRPAEAGPSWYVAALSQVRREGLGDIPIRFELVGGPDLVGHLDRPNTVVGTLGTVGLAEGDQIVCADIEAFTVLTESPSDTSNPNESREGSGEE